VSAVAEHLFEPGVTGADVAPGPPHLAAWAREAGKRVGLPQRPRLLLLVLASYADYRTGDCWPSQERLAEEVGCSTKRVRDDLATLEEHDLVTRRRRGQGQTVLYKLLAQTLNPEFRPDSQAVRSRTDSHGCPRELPGNTHSSPQALPVARGGEADQEDDPVGEVVEILRTATPRLLVAELTVSQVAEQWRDQDAVAAARTVVQWRARGGLRRVDAAGLLQAALRRQAQGLDQHRPPVSEHARRWHDALTSLIEERVPA